MELNVINRVLCVNDVQVIGISASSLFIVGDADTIQLGSVFDTPPESLIIGPISPLPE